MPPPPAGDRPDPDALLARVSKGAVPRARLKIFFGASPGVGKTYAMLEAARVLARDGIAVAVGVVETHGRSETGALLAGLDVIAQKQVAYRGIELAELDVDAVIARRPAVILVDELAHTNAPGVRHPKRWQDVTDLLEAGITVYTTLNVQHVESLNDTVAQITGVRVRETVPDAILERADEIELIDLPPEQLLARLDDGKVYIPEQARRAMDHFFARGNLMALRELALRRTAERVDADVLAYRKERQIGALWPTRERVVVCVGPSPGSEALVRATHRLASGLRAPWHAIHVDLAGAPPLGAADRDRVEAHLVLAESLGGEVMRLSAPSVADALLGYARDHNITRIVAGKPTHPRWRDRFRGGVLDALIRGSGDIELHLIAPLQHQVTARTPVEREPALVRNYLPGLVAVVAAVALGSLAGDRLALADDTMLFLAAIMVASLGGRGSGIAAAALSVVSYDFFFIPPRFTFAVADVRNILTFGVMFTVGIAMGTLVARLRHAEATSRQRERRTAALLAFTSEAAAAVDIADVAAAVAKHVEDVLAAPTAVLVPMSASPDAELEAVAGLEPLAEQEMAVARWAFEHRRPAGRGTETLPQARLLAVPLWVGEGAAGVVALQIERARRRIDVEARQLLEAIARQAGVAMARLRLASEAREAALRVQAEELRSSLLSTVSHDLRTPLAIITGHATQLRDASPAPQQIEALDTIVDESLRLGKILTNLLALTRVESGAEVRREWVPIEELVGAALGRTEIALAAHPVTTDIPAELGVSVDPILLEQVLINLLENAAKHTPAGTAVDLAARRARGGIELDIADRGPGLPAGPEDQVFEKFFRGPNARSAGAGLGLAVCRGIVAAHGGKIEALRREGGGAVFRVWLPAAAAPLETA